MKKILVISDSHGLTRDIKQITERHSTSEVFHCGDFELEADHPAIQQMHVVKGNCDLGVDVPEEKSLEINGINFLLSHGHLYQVDQNLTALSYRASEKNAQIICYGHTHIAKAEKFNEQIFINPGSIYSSRDRRERTYAILTLKDSQKLHVQFYTTDGRVLEELDFQADVK